MASGLGQVNSSTRHCYKQADKLCRLSAAPKQAADARAAHHERPTQPDPLVRARALGLPADQPIVYCERLRFADGEPLAIMRNWLSPRLNDITAAGLEARGLYQQLGERNGRP
jgi:DNA-binding GntR family transcriptional regulator